MRACRHWGAFVSVSSSVVVSACLSTFLRVCFDQPLRWRPVTKVVDDICNNTVELYVAGFHGEIKCCTTVTQSRSRIMTLWIRNYLEDLGPEFTAGMRLFLCVLKAAKLTYRRSRELDDNLKGVHWMVIGIARLQHAGWRDCSPVYSSNVVHDLLRFAADCDFDEVAVDVGKGGISPKRSPAYKKFSNHAIVVMYDGRNLTSRCTPAKLQRIQGRLRQIVEFSRGTHGSFGHSNKTFGPKSRCRKSQILHFRIRCGQCAPSRCPRGVTCLVRNRRLVQPGVGRRCRSSNQQRRLRRTSRPTYRYQRRRKCALSSRRHRPWHDPSPQDGSRIPSRHVGLQRSSSHHRQLRFCSRRRMDHGCMNCGSSRRLLGFQNSRHRRRRTCNCRGSLRDHHRLFQLGQICPLAQVSVT